MAPDPVTAIGILNVYLRSLGLEIVENIGELDDLVIVPYDEGNSLMAFLHTGYYHIHGAAFLYPDKANPIILTSSAASWSITGNKIEIIPANTFTKDFDLHWASISDISANLRSSNCIEQFIVQENKELYNFYLEWFNDNIEKYSIINKEVKK